MFKNWYKALLAIQCVIMLQGCESIGDLSLFHKNELEKLTICVEPGLNLPISVDVVFIYETNTATLLGQLDSQQWFANHAAFAASYDQKFDVISTEIVPGSTSQITNFPRRHHSAISIFAYANS